MATFSDIARTTALVSLVAFWSAVTAVKLLIGWFKNRGHFFYTNDHPKPRVLEGWNHGYLQLSEITMHYVETGEKTKPLIVCIHGFPEFWYSWRYQLRHFEKDYHVVALDMRGYNETEKPQGVEKYASQTLAKDVAEAIEKLGGKAVVLAHDWGAVIAWILATQRPDLVEKLVIMNVPHPKAFMKILRTKSAQLLKSWYMFMFQVPYLPEIVIKAQDYKFIERILRLRPAGIIHSENFTDEDMEAWKYAFSKPYAITGPVNYYRASVRQMGNRHLPDGLVQPKTLIIFGEQDVAIDLEAMELSLTYCREAELKTIPDSSHWVQQDVPEQVNKYVEEFLQKLGCLLSPPSVCSGWKSCSLPSTYSPQFF
ncbi:Protein CEEH-2 a [Aphelenchoides avenae]|nr:Protein CEEH-2 a [Aphelenchus avenae]